MGTGREGEDDDPFAFLEHADTEVASPPPGSPARTRGEPSFSDLGPEDVVDRWRLKSRIGRGGFGVVFEAQDVEDPERFVAIKVVAPEPQGDERWVRRFEQEAEVALTLRHEHIVRTYSHGRLEDGARYLVMELLEGETLDDRLRSSAGLEWPLCARLLRQLGAAIGAAHAAGIVHRDLKPANVFLVEDESEGVPGVKLVDFGLCKGPTALTASMEQIGTVPYMPPEVFRQGARAASERTDVYGLALIAYEMACGRRAFEEPALQQCIARICRGPAPSDLRTRRGDTPEGFVALVAQGLARDAAARPADVLEYAQGLARAASNDRGPAS